MVRSRFRGARSACILFLLIAATSARAEETGIVKILGDGSQGSGVAIYRQGWQDEEYHIILTANHVMKQDTATIDGATATIIARDATTDLALVKVKLPQRRQIYWYGPKWFNPVGKATLYGYPAGTYTTQECTVDEKGDLNCQVRGGGSGGPLFKDNYVVGILTRYHGVATLPQIRAFLEKHNFLAVFEPENPATLKTTATSKVSPVQDDFDRDLETARELIRQLRQLADEEERRNREFFERTRTRP